MEEMMHYFFIYDDRTMCGLIVYESIKVTDEEDEVTCKNCLSAMQGELK